MADTVRCVWTPGLDSKAASTLSFGLTSHLDAAIRGFDVALVLNVANGYFIPLLHARGIPVLINTDGLEWTRGKWGSFARQVFYNGAKLSSHSADLLVSDSDHLTGVWEAEFGTRPKFIPYGAEVVQATDGSKVREAGLESGSYALVVARLAPENNVELTLDALDLAPELPAVVVGSANYRSPLEARLQRMHDAGRIKWLGHVSDQELLTQLWSSAGAYVHGHSVGGTNPALLQALGAGAPTLALDTPFNAEVLRNPEQMYPQDPHVLRDKLQNLLSDPKLRSTWAERGRSIVGDRYQWQRIYDEYETALHGVIAARRGPTTAGMGAFADRDR